MNLIKSPKYTRISKYKLSYDDFIWTVHMKKKWERWVIAKSTLKNNKQRQHNYLSKKAFKIVNGVYVIKNK